MTSNLYTLYRHSPTRKITSSSALISKINLESPILKRWLSILDFFMSFNIMGDVGNFVNLQGSGHWFIMIFSRLTGFFQQFLKYVCPAFSAPLSACTAQAGGSRLDVQRIGGTLFDLPVRAARRRVRYFPSCFR